MSDVEASLAEILGIEDVPGILGVGTFSGWPFVTVAAIEQVADTFHAVSALPMFDRGGTSAARPRHHLLRPRVAGDRAGRPTRTEQSAVWADHRGPPRAGP